MMCVWLNVRMLLYFSQGYESQFQLKAFRIITFLQIDVILADPFFRDLGSVLKD